MRLLEKSAIEAMLSLVNPDATTTSGRIASQTTLSGDPSETK